jgi:uncharacterized protein with beta-barrel porin domain
MTKVCLGGSIAAASRPVGLRFRHAFLGTVAASALSLALGGPALAGPDACTTSGGGTIETCSGDQADGISITAPTNVTTLNVNNLNQGIAPAIGTPGISFASNGDITISSNTGTFGITASNSAGIIAVGAGNVTVTSTGNFAIGGSSASGIAAEGGGAVAVTSTGNINTAGGAANGIIVLSAGAVTVTSTGNISAAGIDVANGIYARGGGAVTVTSIGNITTTGSIIQANGIFASSSGAGAVTVTSTGNITAAAPYASGIYAHNTGTGAAMVTSTGNIATTGDNAYGIRATTSGAGAITVTSTGNVSTQGNLAFAIYANGAGGGAVTVTSTGNLATAGADSNAISVSNRGAGGVTVTSIGNLSTTGPAANGIFAGSLGSGAVRVTSIGNITAAGNNSYGIFAASLGAVTVTSTGNVTAAGNNSFGLTGSSTGGPIAITINSGTVSGGTGIGAGVSFLAGTTNTLTNMGTVTALSGNAIAGNTGNDTVNNFGTVTGNVKLGSGANAFNNMASGIFNSGATVTLGAGNVLTNAGTLSPGGAGVIQTTALTGNLVQTATGRLFTDINIAGNSSDRVNVSGTANLAGAVQVQVQNAILGPWQQTVLTATLGTTNNGLALLASPALHAQLLFPDADDVVVESAGINFLTSGLNKNQTAVAAAVNGAAQTAGLGGPIFNVLLNTTAAGYGPALTQLSGEAATGTQQTTFDAMNMFMGVMTDPFNRGTTSTPGGGASGYASEGDASAYASDSHKRTGAERDAYAMFTKAPAVPFEQRWSVWAAGFGGSQSTGGNAAVGSNNTTSSIAGTVVGADYRFSPFTIAGFAVAGGGTSFSVAGSGGGRSDLFQAGAFIRHDAGAAYISGALAYGWQDIVTNRTVMLTGFNELRAEFNANAFSGRVEGGYRFVAPWVGGIGITPYAAGQFTTFDLPAYAESALAGSNAFALSYGAKSATDPRSELGVRTDKSYALEDGVLTLRGRLAWAHDYDTDRSIGATFQSLPGASFVVNGAAQASDSALVTASVEKKWLNGWSAAATFEGEFSDVTASYAGKGVVRYQW